MNLFVDDTRREPDGWFCARTVEAAQSYLVTDAVDLCSLDHDMGACAECTRKELHVGQTFYNWCPHVMDGTKLVRWMIETGHWPKFKPTVHSANPNGARRMIEMIEQWFGCPAQGPMF